MSQFPTPSIASQADPDTERRARQVFTDAIIQRNRENAPPEAAKQREVRRYSISELNAASLDEIKEKLAKSRLDDRSAFVKALDLVDLPRNALFNLVAPGVADRKRRELEFGSAGLPVVRASDILEELGVENRVARGVMGFVGDVAFDPLIFLGPAKAVSLTGQVGAGATRVAVTRGGSRALRGGARAAARGGVEAVENDRVRELIRAALSKEGRAGEERLSRAVSRAAGDEARQKRLAAAIRRQISTPSNAFRRMPLDGEQSARAAIDAATGRASREFFERYAKRGGGVAHVPFTDLELRVPGGVLPRARAQTRILRAMREISAGGRLSDLPHVEHARLQAALADIIAEARTTVADQSKRYESLRAAHDDAVRAGADDSGILAEMADAVRAREEALDAIRGSREAAERAAKDLGAIRSFSPSAPRELSYNEILAESSRVLSLQRQAQAAVRRAASAESERANFALLRSLRSTLRERVELAKQHPLAGPAPGESEYQFQRRIAEQFAAEQPERVRDQILRLTDEEIEANLAAIDALNDAATAAVEAGATATGNLDAALSSADRARVQFVKEAMGVGQDMTGVSLIARAGAALLAQESNARTNALGENLLRMDEAWVSVFGRRGNFLDDYRRQLQIRVTEGARLDAQKMEANLRSRVAGVLDELGIEDKTGSMTDRAGTYLLALVYQRYAALDDAGKLGPWSFADDDAMFRRMELSGDGVYRATGEPGALQRLVDEGIAGVDSQSEMYPLLRERLQQIADEIPDFFYDLAQQEVKLGLLDEAAVRAGYVNIVTTPAGAQSVMRARTVAGFRGSPSGAGDPLNRVQAYQKPRSTTRHRYYLKEGEERIGSLPVYEDAIGRLYHRFHAFDLAHLDERPEMRELVRRWSELPEAEKTGTQISVFEMNRMAAEGELDAIRSGDFSGGRKFFEDNVIRMMSERLMQHERSVAQRSFLDQMLGHGRAFEGREALSPIMPGGNKYRMASGVVAERVPIDGVDHFKIGSEFFRKLQGVPQNNPLMEMMGERAMHMVYHRDVAQVIERAARMFEPENINPLIGAIDKMTKWWKMATLAHPSWMIVDMIGNVFNGVLGGVRPDHYVKHGLSAFKMMALLNKGGDRLKGIAFDVGGEIWTADRLSRLLIDRGLINQNFAAKEIIDLARSRNLANEYVRETAALPRGVRSRGQIDAIANRRTPVSLDTGPVRTYLSGWYAANGRMNDAMKAIGFLSFLEQGNDIESAIRLANRAFFDYGNMTRFETGVLRRTFPFYCVPDHSEILTRDGWKSCDDLSVGEEVLTYNIETDRTEWQPAEDKAIFDCDQDIMRFQTKSRDIMFTHEHRWAVRRNKSCARGKWYGGNREIVTGENLNTGHAIIAAAPLSETEESALTPEQARLYGWLITDGYWRFKGNSIEAVIYQSPKKFLDEVVRVAGGKPRPPHPDTGVVCVPVLRERLEPMLDILKLGKKGAPTVVTRLGRDAAEAMYSAMRMGDGCVAQGGREGSSASHDFIACATREGRDAIEILSAMLGRRSHTNTRGVYLHRGSRHMKIASGEISEARYSGRVWCPKTKNGTWVMRQNGVVTITGNTWMRNNIAYQIKLMADRPVAFNIPSHLQQAIEEATVGEQAVPMHMRPMWMREQLATQFSQGKSFSLLTSTPQQDFFNLAQGVFGLEGAQDILKFFVTSANPVVSAPVQIGAGQEFFTGRSIGPDRESGDMGAMEFLGQNIRPFREVYNPLGAGAGAIPRTAEEQGPALGVARALLGGRTQDFSRERIDRFKTRELQDRERELRRAVSRAEREGNAAASLRARIDLLQVYRRMLELGFDAEVPKWARETLSGAAAPPGDPAPTAGG